jgi:hypothetical protein
MLCHKRSLRSGAAQLSKAKRGSISIFQRSAFLCLEVPRLIVLAVPRSLTIAMACQWSSDGPFVGLIDNYRLRRAMRERHSSKHLLETHQANGHELATVAWLEASATFQLSGKSCAPCLLRVAPWRLPVLGGSDRGRYTPRFIAQVAGRASWPETTARLHGALRRAAPKCRPPGALDSASPDFSPE